MASIPIFSFVAYSNTGKTTYLERLVACLRDKGLRVGVLKHDGHDFQADTEGKDTHRLSQAGAVVTAISSATKTMWVDRRPLTPEEAAAGFRGVDVILTEGYKTGPWPKIAICRAASGKPLAVAEDACAAIVTDTPLDVPCPQFTIQDPEPMANWLLQEIRRNFHEADSH